MAHSMCFCSFYRCGLDVMTSSVNEKLDEDNFFNGVSSPDSQIISFLIISIDQGLGNLSL